MKNIKKILSLGVVILLANSLSAQVLNPGERVPLGAIVYSLPSTTINLTVEAQHDHFVPGPYARFAQKYLGVEAREEEQHNYRITSIELKPSIEADPSVNIALNLGGQKSATANFLEMINQGLIVWSDSYSGKLDKTLPLVAKNELTFKESLPASNLTKEKSTLYSTVRTASGVEKVAVQQSQVVEKSLEKRAEEVASQIYNLRSKRLNIITGETDATFSGDALRAAIEEINRLEEEYLALFMGKISTEWQRATFDVVPTKSNEKHIYIAFRLSESAGLLAANNISGRPIVLELIPEPNESALSSESAAGKGMVLYRKPKMFNARIVDGQQVLLQSRLPVYQLGSTLSFPINIALGK